MPIYEYACLDCGKLSEFIEGVSADYTKKICRFCGSAVLKRILPQGVTSRMNGIIVDRGGRTCCGREERCGTPPCDEPGSCCR
jgi:putative FmdB family regulatory protein